MATTAVQRPAAILRPANPMYDRVFFSGMVVVLWATVLYGFSKTYYAAGMLAAPLPNRLIHVHGAIMTLWMLLLAVQTGLIASHRVAWHRRLGLAGCGLAAGMLIVGGLAATDMLRRNTSPPGTEPLTFYIVPLTAIALFAGCFYMGYRERSRAAQHKRWMLIGTIALVDAAIGRWPTAILVKHPPLQDVVFLIFFLVIVFYDLISLKRVQKATIWGSVTVMAVHLVRFPLGGTAVWHRFATFMQHHP